MSMNNIQANCWLFYFIRKRCNQASINQWLKWTHALQLSLSGHLTSPSHSAITNHQDTVFLSSSPVSAVRLHMWGSIACVQHEENHESPSYGYMSHALSADVEGMGWGGGFHTDRINMWEWLTSLYVSDVLWMFYISWEAFSKDMINWQNMVNFPSVGYSWLRASFVDCLACPCIASIEAHVCVHACVHSCVRACKHMSVCVYHPCVTTSMMG